MADPHAPAPAPAPRRNSAPRAARSQISPGATAGSGATGRGSRAAQAGPETTAGSGSAKRRPGRGRPGTPAPRPDEIVVAAPDGRQLCNTRAHASLGCLAEVVITFGELGARWHPDALWQDCWRRSYPLCAECWDNVRQIAQARRPGLTITDTTGPPA